MGEEPADRPMREERLRFHLEEYKLVKAEVAFNVRLIHDAFIWGALASGGIAAWLLTNADKISALGSVHTRLAWCIPLFVGVVCCLGFYHFDSVVRRIGAYLRRLEAALAETGLGWEAFSEGEARRSVGRVTRLRFGIGWAIILIGDLALAIFIR